MDLIGVVRGAGQLRRFVEHDLADLLASYDLRAASGALQDADHAADKRNVLWSAINHLEAAEAKLEPDLRGNHRFFSAQALLYIIALRALILRSLDEARLVERCFEKSVRIVWTQNDNAWKRQLSDIVESWNPAGWVRMARFLTSPLGKAARSFDAIAFWDTMGCSNTGRLALDSGPEIDPR